MKKKTGVDSHKKNRKYLLTNPILIEMKLIIILYTYTNTIYRLKYSVLYSI